MVRSVKVELEADTGRYIPPVERAKEATESLDRKVEALDRDLNKIPADAAKAAAAMKLLGDESGKASVKFDDLNKRTSMGTLEQKLIRTRGEVRALAEEFNRTGDSNVLAKLFGKQGEADELEKLKGRLTNALSTGAADGGKEGAKAFSAGMQGGLSTPTLGPIVGVAIAAAVVAALPMVNAALMSVAGLGGIALGVVGQLHDPKVRAAFADMGHDLSGQLTNATKSFREPLIGAAHIFGDTLSKALGSIDFTSLSKLVVPLASGLGGLISNIMPGFNKMLSAAGPILRSLATDLPVLGSAISDMFEMFAKGGKGAQESLRGLIYVLTGLILAVGGVVLVTSKLVEWFVAAGSAVGGFIEHLGKLTPWAGFLTGLGRGVKGFFDSFNSANDIQVTGKALNAVAADAHLAADDFDRLAGMVGKTKETFDTVAAAATGKVFGAIMSADQATLGWHESLLALHDALDQNGKAIDRHTGLVDMNSKAGLANREAVLAAMTANMQQYQAMVAVGASAADATAAYEANTGALEGMLRKAGYTQKQIDDMIGSLKSVPRQTNAEIAMHGLESALNNLGNLIASLNGLNGRDYGFTVTEKHVYESDYLTFRQGERMRWGGIYQHAAEGLLSAKVYSASGPARYAFAEPATGGEAFVPRFGEYNRSTSIIDQAARWYGGRFAAGGMGGGGYVDNRMVTYQINDATDPSRVIAAIKRYEQSNGKNWRN